MSIAAMNWAWSLSELKASETLLLVALADQANDEGFCWPSQDTLAFKSRCSVRTVRRTVARLESLGLVHVERRSTPSGRQSNLYWLNVGAEPDEGFSLEIQQPDVLAGWIEASASDPVDNPTFPHETSNRTNCPVGVPNRTSVTPQPDTGDRLLHISKPSMEPPTMPAMPVGESSARGAELRGVDGGDASRATDAFAVREPVAGAGGAGAPAAQGVDPDGLLVDCLPAGWLDRLDASARRIVAARLAQGIAEGFTPSLIQSRLSANKLPPAEAIKNFSGLVIHRVRNALEAGREPTAEERIAERKRAHEAFVAAVLAGTDGLSLGARYNEIMRLSATGAGYEIEGFEAAYRLVCDEFEAAGARR